MPFWCLLMAYSMLTGVGRSWLQFRQSEFGSCSRSSVGAALYTVGGVPPEPSIRPLPTCNRTWHGVWVSCSKLLLSPFAFHGP